MNPAIEIDGITVYQGDCRKVMTGLPAGSVDAVVTDPPYELGFMGKRWDASGIAYNSEVWSQVFRVLKPGGHLLAFGGTRTWHRLAVAIEDAGFAVRDSIAWMYGSGFPKSLDVSKAIDKAGDVERNVVASYERVGRSGGILGKETVVTRNITEPATPAAEQWQGWGTALKPAFEPIVVARKPLIGTVAENVLAHGTGALNIDGCRIGTDGGTRKEPSVDKSRTDSVGSYLNSKAGEPIDAGRWPANVILDESQAAELDKQSGVGVSRSGGTRTRTDASTVAIAPDGGMDRGGHDDTGGASRFFYVPKANASERPRDGETAHPTVKPLALMQYLVRLVTPPNGMVLDPFAGSGATLEAAYKENCNAIGIELTDDYLPLIRQRVDRCIERGLW